MARRVCGKSFAQRLGELMNASHESCCKFYECSCEELDELVEAFRSCGLLEHV